MTTFLRRVEGLPNISRPGDLIALTKRDPYWAAIRLAYERAIGLFFDGFAVHIVPVFEDSVPLEIVDPGDKILIPIRVAGTERQMAEQVENDLDSFAVNLSAWIAFVPALLLQRDPFEDLGTNPTKQ